MARTGRPKSETPSNHRVGIRLTEQEYEFLKQYADTNELTMTQAIKSGIDLLRRMAQE